MPAVNCRVVGIWPHQPFLCVSPMHTGLQLQKLLCMVQFLATEGSGPRTLQLTQQPWVLEPATIRNMWKLLNSFQNALGCKQTTVKVHTVSVIKVMAVMHVQQRAVACLSSFTSTMWSTSLPTVFRCCFSRLTMKVSPTYVRLYVHYTIVPSPQFWLW